MPNAWWSLFQNAPKDSVYEAKGPVLYFKAAVIIPDKLSPGLHTTCFEKMKNASGHPPRSLLLVTFPQLRASSGYSLIPSDTRGNKAKDAGSFAGCWQDREWLGTSGAHTRAVWSSAEEPQGGSYTPTDWQLPFSQLKESADIGAEIVFSGGQNTTAFLQSVDLNLFTCI